MKQIILVIAMLYSFQNIAQQNKLLFKSSELFVHGNDSTNIKSISTSPIGRYIRVKYQNGSFEKILKDSLWGVVVKGTVYRIYEKGLFVVNNYDTNGLIEYKDWVYIYYGKVALPQQRFFYSKDLNSKIVNSKNKLLE